MRISTSSRSTKWCLIAAAACSSTRPARVKLSVECTVSITAEGLFWRADRAGQQAEPDGLEALGRTHQPARTRDRQHQQVEQVVQRGGGHVLPVRHAGEVAAAGERRASRGGSAAAGRR